MHPEVVHWVCGVLWSLHEMQRRWCLAQGIETGGALPPLSFDWLNDCLLSCQEEHEEWERLQEEIERKRGY